MGVGRKEKGGSGDWRNDSCFLSFRKVNSELGWECMELCTDVTWDGRFFRRRMGYVIVTAQVT